MNDCLEKDVTRNSDPMFIRTGYRTSAADSLQLIWDNIDGFGSFYAPVLIDCNGDHYLDVICKADTNLTIFDGSPFNNHNRLDIDDRELWVDGVLSAGYPMAVSPVISKLVSGDLQYLEIGMPYSDKFYFINTKFKYHDESYQPDPWLKAYYSLNNWNNTQEDPPY
jgi:hypothetical protein